MWWSSLIVIQAFVLGQGFLPPNGQTEPFQAFLVMVLAVLVAVVMFSLNGEPGNKYGIPYLIQTRSAFGVRGSKIVEFLRALPAIVWYGIGTWIARAVARRHPHEARGVHAALRQVRLLRRVAGRADALAYRGIRTMKWFNVYCSVDHRRVMIYMLVHILQTHGFQIQASWRRPADWGTPFWAG